MYLLLYHHIHIYDWNTVYTQYMASEKRKRMLFASAYLEKYSKYTFSPTHGLLLGTRAKVINKTSQVAPNLGRG